MKMTIKKDIQLIYMNWFFYLVLAVLSIGIVLKFNIYLFRDAWSPCTSWSGFISSSILTFMLLLLFCKSKAGAFLVSLVIILPAFVAWYIYTVFGMDINYSIMASILEVTPEEMADYLTAKNFLLILCFIVPLFVRLVLPPPYKQNILDINILGSRFISYFFVPSKIFALNRWIEKNAC